MIKSLLAAVWRGIPGVLRRWTVRVVEPKFTVTAAAVVVDAQDRVLLLRHVFRAGNEWGIPGGFLRKGEQPDEAVRRELREEVGLELERAEVAFVRTLRRVNQVEIIFRCSVRGEPQPKGLEVKGAAWYALGELPERLGASQRALIERALESKTADGRE